MCLSVVPGGVIQHLECLAHHRPTHEPWRLPPPAHTTLLSGHPSGNISQHNFESEALLKIAEPGYG